MTILWMEAIMCGCAECQIGEGRGYKTSYASDGGAILKRGVSGEVRGAWAKTSH